MTSKSSNSATLIDKFPKLDEAKYVNAIGNKVTLDTYHALKVSMAEWVIDLSDDIKNCHPWPESDWESYDNLQAPEGKKRKNTDKFVIVDKKETKKDANGKRVTKVLEGQKETKYIKLKRIVSVTPMCKADIQWTIMSLANEVLAAQPAIAKSGATTAPEIRRHIEEAAIELMKDGHAIVSPIIFRINAGYHVPAGTTDAWGQSSHGSLKSETENAYSLAGIRQPALGIVLDELIRFLGLFSLRVASRLIGTCKPADSSDEVEAKAEAKKKKEAAKKEGKAETKPKTEGKPKTVKKARKPLSEGLAGKSVSVDSKTYVEFVMEHALSLSKNMVSPAFVYRSIDDFERHAELKAASKKKKDTSSNGKNEAAPAPPVSRPTGKSVVPDTPAKVETPKADAKTETPKVETAKTVEKVAEKAADPPTKPEGVAVTDSPATVTGSRRRNRT